MVVSPHFSYSCLLGFSFIRALEYESLAPHTLLIGDDLTGGGQRASTDSAAAVGHEPIFTDLFTRESTFLSCSHYITNSESPP